MIGLHWTLALKGGWKKNGQITLVIKGSTGAQMVTQLPLFLKEKPGRDGLMY